MAPSGVSGWGPKEFQNVIPGEPMAMTPSRQKPKSKNSVQLQ